MYSSNILNKKKPNVIRHILTSNFVFDLSCADTFKLKKSLIRTGFQNSFCRGLTPSFSKGSFPPVRKAKFETVQFALHNSRNSTKPLGKPFLQNNISKTSANVPFRFFNFKAKTNIVPYFFGKNVGVDSVLPLDLKLNSLSVLYKQKEQSRNTKNFFEGIIKKKFAFFLKKPLVFIKVISEVFNKAIKKGCLCKETNKKSESSLIAAFKKPKKGFFSFSPSSLVFDMKNKNSLKSEITDKKHIKNRKVEGGWIATLESSSSLADQKRWSSQVWTSYPGAFKSGEFFGGSLVRADWILSRFIEQFGKKKINPRAAMNQQINDIRILMDKMGSECPIKGMRITITGRLGSRKKAMAQQISKCVGKVPLSTFRQNVDYRQGVLPTKFGLVGVKIWVCYANGAS